MGIPIKLLFSKGPSYFSRVVLLVLIAVTLLVIGRYTHWLDPVRSKLDVLTMPFYWASDIPERLSGWLDERLLSRQEIEAENKLLQNKVRVQESRLQQMGALVADNLSLRQLMNSSEIVQDRVLVAELIGVSPDPLVHKVIIDKKKPTNDIETSIKSENYMNKSIVLVDDVLHSGTTLIYGVKHFLEVPIKKIKTVVLVDRNHKNFPIKADFKGISLSTSLNENVAVVFEKNNYYALLE